ncbi:hypothetical protein [Glycomyces arizonensis]|uniref:hypothetical protein n=1 Tax=Glycomyces arizonensis TaxID=256035 RepID=UPI000421DC6A|nr:hypothetical protein [Glycomyces arizonensis]
MSFPTASPHDVPPDAARDRQWEWHAPQTMSERAAPEPVEAKPGGTPGRGALVAIAVVAVLALAVAGLVAVLGDGGSPEGPAAEGCEGADCGPETATSPGPQTMEIPDGYLGVASLGALTPAPGPPWAPYAGPGADELLAEDAHALEIQHTATWISYLMVGRLGEFGLVADPENLREAAAEIVDTWVFDYPYSGTTGLERSEPVLTDTRVDSHPAVLLETRVTWDTLDASPDMYEDVALLLVDPGEEGIFLGVAAVPESGTAHYAGAVDALMQTTFRHNTYLP